MTFPAMSSFGGVRSDQREEESVPWGQSQVILSESASKLQAGDQRGSSGRGPSQACVVELMVPQRGPRSSSRP